MNSTFLRLLAVLMMIAAIVTAWLGYRASNKEPTDKLAVVIPSFSQVVARNDIPAGHLLTADDLDIVSTPHHDKLTFSNTQSLIGKAPTIAVMKGVQFKTSHFPTHSSLVQALASDERAVAIKVNEVIGVGGFIQPGNYVDVLLYLRAERENGDVSSSQVVLSNVKVLAYGALTLEEEHSQESAPTQSVSTKLGASNSRSEIKKEKDSRSAILAVPYQNVSKLMLADSTGVLRLALRGGPLPNATSSTANNQFIRLGDVSQPLNEQHSNQAITSITSPKVAVKKHSIRPTTKRERVIIHRGEQVDSVNVSR